MEMGFNGAIMSILDKWKVPEIYTFQINQLAGCDAPIPDANRVRRASAGPANYCDPLMDILSAGTTLLLSDFSSTYGALHQVRIHRVKHGWYYPTFRGEGCASSALLCT